MSTSQPPSFGQKKKLYLFDQANRLQNDSVSPESNESLFSRAPTKEYIKEWEKLLEKPSTEEKRSSNQSLIVFQLGLESFAMPTKAIVEVSEPKKIHTVPHLTNTVFRGVVNIKGQLKLCISLHHFLQVSRKHEVNQATPKAYPRFLVFEVEGQDWVFEVDELFGIYDYDISEILNVPTNVHHSQVPYIKGVLQWSEYKTVSLINENAVHLDLKKAYTHPS